MTEFGPDPVGRVLTFTSKALAKNTEITGPIVLKLFVSSDQPDTDFIIKLSDQFPLAQTKQNQGYQPKFLTITKGWLKASHRDKNKMKSKKYRPFYNHINPQPLIPNKIYSLDIEIHPTAHVFMKGHRIRLEISNGDSPLTDAVFTHQYMPHKHGSDTIYHDSIYKSRLDLPIVENIN